MDKNKFECAAHKLSSRGGGELGDYEIAILLFASILLYGIFWSDSRSIDSLFGIGA